MTDDDRRKLRELAERARKPQGWKRIAFQAARLDEFREAASPDVLLRLLDSLDALRRARDEAREAVERMRRHAGTAINTRSRDINDWSEFCEEIAKIGDALLGGGEAGP